MTLGTQVTLIDVGIAFLAGLLIIPAIYVAQAQGITIFADHGSLVSGPSVVLTCYLIYLMAWTQQVCLLLQFSLYLCQ